MRSVRTKFLAVIVLCLLPMAVATRIFYWVSRDEMREQALEEMKAARDAFTADLNDRQSTLRLAGQLLGSDPDLLLELVTESRSGLHEHLAGFSAVYPAVRIFLCDLRGTALADSGPQPPDFTLTSMPEVRAALEQGRPFEGVTRISKVYGSRTYPEGDDSLALVRPVERDGRRVGALVAAFPLDGAYLDDVEQKERLAIALKIGKRVVAHSKGHPAPELELPLVWAVPLGGVKGQALPPPHDTLDLRAIDGREFAFSAFAPPGLRSAEGPVTVTAAKDVTVEFKSQERFLWYRLLVLALIAVVALAIGLWIANPIVRAIQVIAAALPGVLRKEYSQVIGVRTGDELQQLAETYNGVIQALQEAERQRQALGKYLSRAARDAVDRGRVDLGGTTMPATVLFSDIRGFTSLSEKMEPERVLVLLNRYFTEMVGAVVRHRGIVDKFMGDCIMAVWGPPTAQPDDPLNAIRAALEMRERLKVLNAQLAAEGLPELRTGIGLHTGPVVAGNMGAESTAELEGKMEYTVIGDTVNLASRLESLTKELHAEVLLSEDTWRCVSDRIDVEPLEPIKVRGREQPVAIYRLIGIRTEAALKAV